MSLVTLVLCYHVCCLHSCKPQEITLNMTLLVVYLKRNSTQIVKSSISYGPLCVSDDVFLFLFFILLTELTKHGICTILGKNDRLQKICYGNPPTPPHPLPPTLLLTTTPPTHTPHPTPTLYPATLLISSPPPTTIAPHSSPPPSTTTHTSFLEQQV